MTIIAATIAGIFAVISAVLAWRLRSANDDRVRKTALDKEKRDDIKRLYTDTFSLFEQAINKILNKEGLPLEQAFSENNARIHLLAPECILNQYSVVVSLLMSWLKLFANASPHQMQFGDQTLTLLQAPDPTAKYKEPANAEYQKLQDELKQLIGLMREELDVDTMS